MHDDDQPTIAGMGAATVIARRLIEHFSDWNIAPPLRKPAADMPSLFGEIGMDVATLTYRELLAIFSAVERELHGDRYPPDDVHRVLCAAFGVWLKDGVRP